MATAIPDSPNALLRRKETTEALNARGIRTARGGEWHHSTGRNLLART